mgnify:FL=1
MGPESTKLVKKQTYKSGLFNYHDAFSYDVEVFADGRVGIWLDPSTRWKQPLPNYIEYHLKQGRTKEEIAESLKDCMVSCPSTMRGDTFRAKVSNVYLKKLTEHGFSINDTETNLFNWWTQQNECRIWLQRNNITP